MANIRKLKKAAKKKAQNSKSKKGFSNHLALMVRLQIERNRIVDRYGTCR